MPRIALMGSGPGFFLLLVLASLLVILVPDKPKRLLVPADGWHATAGGFMPQDGNPRQLPQSLMEDPQARFWGTWSPEGVRKGRLESPAFVLPKRGLGLPVRGFPGADGNRVELVCLATGERRRVATMRTGNDWVIARFDPGAAWCRPDREVRLEVEVGSDSKELAVGAPFKGTWASGLKASAVQVAAYLVLAWGVMVGLAWLVFQATRRCTDARLRLAAPLAALGLMGYLAFFVFRFSPAAGGVLATAVMLSGGIGILWFLRRGDTVAPDPSASRLQSAGWLWLATALLVLAIFGLAEVNAGTWSPNSRFAPAAWASDNQLPQRVGQALANGEMEQVNWMGPWRVSDRPPLAYGWHAIFVRTFEAPWVPKDGLYLLHQHAWAVGILLNTLWAPVVLLLVRHWSRSPALAFGLVLLCLMSPFVLFSSGFAWPKLLAAAFGLLAAALLFDFGRDRRLPLRLDTPAFLMAALLSVLALQSHGGAVFGILAMLILMPMLRGIPSWPAMGIALLLCGALLAPWMLYQKLVDPPGNALLKFAFAGTFGFGEEDMGVFETIRRSYSGLSLPAWLAGKGEGLKVLVVGGGSCGLHEVSLPGTSFDLFRIRDFFYVLPAMALLVAGAVAGALAPAGPRRVFPSPTPWLAWGLMSLLIALLVSPQCHVNHHQSYQAVLGLYLGLLMLASRHPWVLGATGVAVVGYGLVVWVLDPLRHFDGIDASIFFLLPAAAVAAIRAGALLRNPSSPQGSAPRVAAP